MGKIIEKKISCPHCGRKQKVKFDERGQLAGETTCYRYGKSMF